MVKVAFPKFLSGSSSLIALGSVFSGMPLVTAPDAVVSPPLYELPQDALIAAVTVSRAASAVEIVRVLKVFMLIFISEIKSI